MQSAIAAGTPPIYNEDIWRRHKGTFLDAQHDKCGYCEVISINHPGAVDHHAPKSQIDELLAPGGEILPTANVAGRKTGIISNRGYYWLAYDWTNWLFVCERCNSGWKRCLFPVELNPRTLPPRRDIDETPLLLNPFGRIDPSDHLEFSRFGQVVSHARSTYGDATIETCGLDRESLRRAREGLAADTHRHLDRLLDGIRKKDRLRAHDASVDLLSLGGDTRAHAGMVRAIVIRELSLSWTEFKQLERRLRRRIP